MAISQGTSLGQRRRVMRMPLQRTSAPPQEQAAPTTAEGVDRVRQIYGAIVAVVFIAGISLPLIVQLSSQGQNDTTAEQRQLAPFPQIEWRSSGIVPRPKTRDLEKFPERFESYYNDHFGLRDPLIGLYNRGRLSGIVPQATALYGRSRGDAVAIGQDGWLYLAGNQCRIVARRTPLFTPRELDAWESVFRQRQQWLAERGIGYVVMLAPDKHTIYPEHLPRTLQPVNEVSRLDQLIERLRSVPGLTVVDPRGVLLAAKEQYPTYYQTDTHWNQFGALLAYQELMRGVANIFPRARAWPLADFQISLQNGTGGDLARLLTSVAAMTDYEVQVLPLRPRTARWESRSPPPGIDEWSHFVNDAGPLDRVVVLHDSFMNYVEPLLSEHARQVDYFRTPGFPQSLIEEIRPQLVVQEMVERFLAHAHPDDIEGAQLR